MIRVTLRTVLAVVFSLVLAGVALASPQDTYLQIYLTLQEGERLESARQFAEARQRYQSSLEKLERLRKQNPDWEPVIVRYRINYCKEKLAKVPAVSDPVASSPSTQPVVETQGEVASIGATTAALAPSTGTEETLRARVKELESELADTKRQLSSALSENKKLVARQKELTEEIALLKEGASDTKMSQLLEENRSLQERLASAESEIQTLKEGASPEALATLQEQLKKTQDQLALALQQSEALQKANDEYRSQLEETQTKLAVAEANASRLEPMDKENRMLRDIVDRQLKEQARRDAARRLAMEELTRLKVESTQLKTQMDILASPLITLSEEELSMLRQPTTGLNVDPSGSISAPLEQLSGDYSSKPRIPANFRDVAEQASKLFAEQKFDDAAAMYQRILNDYPESLYALSNIGVVRFQQGKYADAETALTQAVKLAPQDAFSHSILGIVLYQQGKFDQAVQILTRAVALDPNDPKTRNYLGISASQKGWQEAAEQECRKAIELDPNYGDAHFNLAVIYATQRPPALELARKHYNQAIKLGIPSDPQLERMLK